MTSASIKVGSLPAAVGAHVGTVSSLSVVAGQALNTTAVAPTTGLLHIVHLFTEAGTKIRQKTIDLLIVLGFFNVVMEVLGVFNYSKMIN